MELVIVRLTGISTWPVVVVITILSFNVWGRRVEVSAVTIIGIPSTNPEAGLTLSQLGM
jgi:hypothetical protein